MIEIYNNNNNNNRKILYELRDLSRRYKKKEKIIII